ncbi:type II secretion system protein N [Pseudomonas sp. BMS12]|uniref:type II secretion system protein N n=1 Tax=Pseudomonas sp. BMS12 TaxID=1796033 RepID=UPI000AA1DA56|nr:type II secretion system protein N [Pseudomonas sp. BMS12]
MNEFISSKVWGVAAALLLAVYALAFVYWQQRVLPAEAAPLVVTGPEVVTDSHLDVAAVGRMFGAPEKKPSEDVKESQLSLKLVASYVVPGKNRSAAIISRDGDKQKLYFIGDKIQAGVELKAVQPGRILIKRNGVLESISLEDAALGTAMPVEHSAAPVAVAAAEVPVVKPGNNQAMLEKLKKLKSLAAGDH